MRSAYRVRGIRHGYGCLVDTEDGSGYAASAIVKLWVISSVDQPGSATSAAVAASFGGDPFYLPAGASSTASLRFYTGQATTASLTGLVTSTIVDTGPVSTSIASSKQQSLATLTGSLISGSVLSAGVTTGVGGSQATASLTSLNVGVPGLTIAVAAVTATSASTCSGSTASTTIGALKINNTTIIKTTGTPAPNTTINLGLVKIVLNQQTPIPGGLAVNAINATLIGGTQGVKIAAARRDIHNC